MVVAVAVVVAVVDVAVAVVDVAVVVVEVVLNCLVLIMVAQGCSFHQPNRNEDCEHHQKKIPSSIYTDVWSEIFGSPSEAKHGSQWRP